MSEHQIETAFLRRVIRYDDGETPRKLEKSILQVEHDRRCVGRTAFVAALFLMLGLAGVGYGGVLHRNFPYNGSEVAFRILCELVLASLICLVGCAGFLTVYRRKLKRLRGNCRQLVSNIMESRLGKRDVLAGHGRHPGSEEFEASAFQFPPDKEGKKKPGLFG